jgi:hypothetical protein
MGKRVAAEAPIITESRYLVEGYLLPIWSFCHTHNHDSIRSDCRSNSF